MGTFVKEYGLIAVLIAVALSGYFLVGDRRGDIMDYTLDMIGTRLVDLAQGEDEKQEIARQFAAFSERVERDEVAPEVIESVAANVLNLRARGAMITPEEAELMLYPESPAVLPSPADSVSGVQPAFAYTVASKPGTPVRVHMEELGERITYMFEMADAIGSQADSNRTHIHFARDEHGVHVILDPSIEPLFESTVAGNLYADMSEKEWVRWEANFAEQQERNAKRLEAQAEKLAALENAQKDAWEASQARRIDALKRVQKLAMMGATTDLDTLVLNQEVESLLQGLSFEIESMVDSDFMQAIGSGASVNVVVETDSTKGRQ